MILTKKFKKKLDNKQFKQNRELYINLPSGANDSKDNIDAEMSDFDKHVESTNHVSIQAGGLYNAYIKSRNDDGSCVVTIGDKYDMNIQQDKLAGIDQNDSAFKVYVEKVSSEIKVDFIRALDMVMWDNFKKFKNNGDIMVCEVQQVVHCGYMVRIFKRCKTISKEEVVNSLDTGIVATDEFESTNVNDYVNAFLPHSQCMNAVKEGDKIYIVILNLDSKKKNIIVSSKKVVFTVKKTHQEQLFDLAQEAIKKGDKIIAQVVVTNVVEFGIFAKVMSVIIKDKEGNELAVVDNLNGCIDGLLHVSELSWKRDNKLTTIQYSSGDSIQVIITDIDREKSRVHFSLKALQGNPWQLIEKKFKVGQVYKDCTVSGVADDNILINITNVEIEGSVSANEISWNKVECDIYKLFVGMKVDVMVIDIDIEKEKLSLSIKKVNNMGNLVTLKQKFKEQANIVEGEITAISYNHLLLKLESGLVGKVLQEYLHWDINKRSFENYKVGDTLKCKVVVFNEYTEEIILGVKQLEKDPVEEEYNKLTIGNKYKCIVSSVQYSNVMVKINNIVDGSIHYSQLSSDKNNRNTAAYKVGQEIDAKVLDINKDIGIVIMSLLEDQ